MSKINKKLKETKNNLKMSWKFIRNRKKSLFIMIFFALLLSIISVITPILSAKLLLNLTSGLLNELILVAIFIFVVEISRNIFSFLLRKINDKYMVDTVTEVQMEMFSETLKIQASDIDKNTSGIFIDRINNDTTEIINIFSSITSSFINFISNLGILIAILIINKYMFIYFVVSSLISAYVSKKGRDLYHEQSKVFRKVREKRTGLISEIIRGIRDVKLLNGNEGILKKTKKQLGEVNKERLLMLNTTRKYNLWEANLRDFFDVIFFILGTILVSTKNLSVANFVVLHMYKGRVEYLMSFYNNLAQYIKDFNLAATRVFEVLGDSFKKEDNNGIEIKELKGDIEFRNVMFSYNKEPVLKNINFNIKSGERIGFVGESGSGKSTIFNLITRLYTLKSGQILIDDINIKDISIESLRKNISLIPQNPYIFNFSIEDNIKITNPSATHEEIIEACKKADIYNRILEFENGFETQVGEGGVTLSGGEKQRLAIARSLLKNTNIILFDEATSALDNLTQYNVQNAIYGLDKTKTILIIAHRLSTVISCDKIVVVDDGNIIDIGSHEELLNRCNKYKELFKYEQIKKQN